MAWLGLGLGLTFRVRVSTVSRVRARVGAKVFTKSDAASYAAGSVGSIFSHCTVYITTMWANA